MLMMEVVPARVSRPCPPPEITTTPNYQTPGRWTTPIRETLFFRSGVNTLPTVWCIIMSSARVSTQFSAANCGCNDKCRVHDHAGTAK